MRYPDFLREKGSIRFAAPSFGCNIEPYRSSFDHALKKWKGLGHETILGPNVYEGSGVGISNQPRLCAQELQEAFVSAEGDVIISCGGGELMCEILDDVDFSAIAAAAPKWYMGYSDNTNMTFLLPTLCDTAAIYGPCAPSFGMEPWHESLQDAYDLLRGKRLEMKGYDLYETESLRDEEHPLEPYHVTEPRRIRAFVPDGKGGLVQTQEEVSFEGRLLGGCMDILVNLTGTGYDKVREFNERYTGDGVIWFLESCDLNVFGIRRAIWQMLHAGWFGALDDQGRIMVPGPVKGFMIGRPLVNGQEMLGLDQYRAVTDLLGQCGVPVLMDLDLGHIPPMMPLICGALAKVKCREQELSVKMECR